jgi:beta-lactamase superfamily II metal-dependent hydrolase
MYETDLLPVGDGQRSGDAIAIRFELPGWARPAVMIIDGGYRDDGEALVDHVQRYYDASHVDLVVATHSDADHINGLAVVLERLTVGELLIHRPGEHAAALSALSQQAGTKRREGRVLATKLERSLSAVADLVERAQSLGVRVTEPFTGLQRLGGTVTVLGPSREFYESLLPDFRGASTTTSASLQLSGSTQGGIGVLTRVYEDMDTETLTDHGVTSAENNSSAIVQLHVDGGRLLFTGDAGIEALHHAADEITNQPFAPLRFVQIPHHGSKHNVGPAVLDRLLGRPGVQPPTSFIAVASAADADPKHPSQLVLNAFIRRGACAAVTNGQAICSRNGDVPARPDWQPLLPLPLVPEFTEED